MSDPQQLHGPQLSRLLLPWDSPDRSTGVGCHCLLLVKGYFSIIKKTPNLADQKYDKPTLFLVSDFASLPNDPSQILPTLREDPS